MTDAEKDQIAHGKLVKFTYFENDTSDKMQKNGTVFICAVSTNSPTAETKCYPRMSEYFGKAFANAGIQVASSKEQAGTVVYATLGYLYVGAAVPFWSTGDSYRAMFDETIERSLEGSGKPELSKATMEDIYKKDGAVQKDLAHESTLEAVGKVAAGVASLAIGGVNGGLYASQALTGIANPASINAPYGTTGPKQMIIWLHEAGADGKDGPVMKFIGTYEGPLDMFQAFDKLFPSAAQQTAGLFAVNTTSSKDIVTK